MTSSQNPANQPQSTGLDKKTSAILSYALGWLTGIIFSLAGLAVGVFAVVVWIMAMVQANNVGGVRAKLPIVGELVAPYADRLADSVK
ncbi:hypothetical protein AB0N05_10890 [Nocardia sp. NPDC051030]|uniref:hypothetical protein n=1 Tax=Nocardia sp. NPDC051030 TaxID=3155162 RepID=UPI003444D78E